MLTASTPELDLVEAYIDTDRQTGASDKRDKALTAGRDAKAEHEALLAIEAELEEKTLAALAGTGVAGKR